MWGIVTTARCDDLRVIIQAPIKPKAESPVSAAAEVAEDAPAAGRRGRRRKSVKAKPESSSAEELSNSESGVSSKSTGGKKVRPPRESPRKVCSRIGDAYLNSWECTCIGLCVF